MCKQIRNVPKVSSAPSPHARRFMEEYDRARSEGLTRQQAAERAVRVLPCARKINTPLRR